MSALSFISWNVNPNIIENPLMIRYYGLCWAVSFMVGYYLIKKMLLNEKQDAELADKFLMYTLIGGVLGARLGHVFFYQPEVYLADPISILKIWEGGLASHGGAIGVIITTWLLSRKIKKPMLWSLDKIVITAAIAACFIRVGNLMNSEIIGAQSESGSAFFFEYQAEHKIAGFFDIDQSLVDIQVGDETIEVDGFNYPKGELYVSLTPQDRQDASLIAASFIEKTSEYYLQEDEHFFGIGGDYSMDENNVLKLPIAVIPRIPTQLWEAISYLAIFLIMFWGYWKKQWYRREGMLMGVFFVTMFTARLIIEFWKEHQALSEEATLNMGQWLSLPAIIAGVLIMIYALRKPLKQE